MELVTGEANIYLIPMHQAKSLDVLPHLILTSSLEVGATLIPVYR